jgi:PAS domain S-box-containing protein
VLTEPISEIGKELAVMEQESETRQNVAFASSIFEANETIRTLLESLTEGVVAVDRKGHILFFNHSAEKLFGYTSEEIVGKPLITLLPKRYAEGHGNYMEVFFRNPQPRPMGLGMDLIACQKNGEEFPVEISLSHLKIESGIFALAFIVDISQRKARELDMQERNEELDSFAHMVAHDLKSSLALLIGYGDLLRAEFTKMSETEIAGMLDTIVRSSYTMNSIIQELLLFAGLRNEQVKREPVTSEDNIHDAMQRLRIEIDQHNAVIEMPDEFAFAIGYGPWLEEVWYNYLSNAIKYGGQPPIIQIGSENWGSFSRFWVKDNGPGLSAEQQEGLFEPFARGNTGAAHGHGLGLSIVKRIITKLGGSVGIESRPGEGSTFSFTLPTTGNTDNIEQ